MTFRKRWLHDLLKAKETEEARIVQDHIVDKDTWTDLHRMVFLFDNRFYFVYYRNGAVNGFQEDHKLDYTKLDLAKLKPTVTATEVFAIERVTTEFLTLDEIRNTQQLKQKR